MIRIIIPLILLCAACKSDAPAIEDHRTEEERIEQTPAADQVPAQDVTEVETPVESTPISRYSVKVVEGPNGWGYQLFEGDKLLINQPHRPAVPGIQGFDSREDAQTTANYILQQVENGNFPPTISGAIMDSLGVL